MPNFNMALYLLDRLNIYHTYEKRDNFWVIETENFEFWFEYDSGDYCETFAKLSMLGDM